MGSDRQRLWHNNFNCSWRMMVRTRPSVSSSILVILACLWGCIGAESLRANFLDNILADLSQDYQQLEYGDALDYNDIGLMSQYGPEDRNDADAGSFKQDNENQKPAKESGKNHMKSGVLPAYCDPPNPCPKGYTAEDGCIVAPSGNLSLIPTISTSSPELCL